MSYFSKIFLALAIVILLFAGYRTLLRGNVNTLKSDHEESNEAAYNEILLNTHAKAENENSTLDRRILLTNHKKDTIFLKDLLSEQDRLFFVMKGSNCQPCVSQELSTLRSYQEGLKNSKPVILGKYPDFRSLTFKVKEYEISFPVYTILEEDIHLKADEVNKPYFFLVNEKLTAYNFHFANKYDPDPTTYYLDALVNKSP